MPIVVVDFLALVRHHVLRKSWALKSVGKVLRVPVPMPRSTGSKMPSFFWAMPFYFSGNSYRYRISRIGRGPTQRGCDPEFLDQAIEFSPRRIVYVSCEPSTQARDAQVLLAAGYQAVAAQPFDLFPQTRHVENVLTLVR